VWTLLARAFATRGRALAALGAVLEARAAGAAEVELDGVVDLIKGALGPAYVRWEQGMSAAAE
jgi:hypothetical protein